MIQAGRESRNQEFSTDFRRTAPERYAEFLSFLIGQLPGLQVPPDLSLFYNVAGLEQVLNGAGATLPERDAVDRRVVADVRNRSGSIIDSPAEVGGHPHLARGTPPIDSDHDGMPDAWEAEHGLDSSDASDGSGDLDGDGYTNVEEFLHSLLE